MSAPSLMSMHEDSRESVMHYVQNNIDSITFKSLKREEVDPPHSEKIAHMKSLLSSDPGLFLTRWGRNLPPYVLEHFEPLRETHYEVDIQMRYLTDMEVEPKSSWQTNQHLRKKIMNRRFQYLKKVLKDSEYFAEESMRLREPALYEYYIGQYIPSHLRNREYGTNVTLVQRIMNNLDRSIIEEKLRTQRIIESEQEEEEEEDDDDDEMGSTTDAAEHNQTEFTIAPLSTSLREQSSQAQQQLENNSSNEPQGEPSELLNQLAKEQQFRDSQKDEYMRIMEELFLEGRDMYDDLDQEDMDLQDKYFDEEDEDVETGANGTGVYDY